MRYLLEIPDLDERAFKPEAGRMRLYGKGSPPPPPDFAAAAQATAAGNLDAARYATEANRINQYTPYGSLTYSRTPTGQLDTAAYNRAMEDYNRRLSAFNQGTAPTASNPLDSLINSFRPEGGVPQTAPIRPQESDFMSSGERWSQTMSLAPEAQAALDQQLALNRKYGETANIGFDRARELFENPQLDTSVLPERAINVGQTAQEALMARLQPQLQQQEEAMRQRLANSGIGLGSTAFQRESLMQGQRANDLMLQAALQGINLDQANRSAALQEQAYLQDRPLNLINALRTGNQVQAPQFAQFAQQATTQGPDMLGAAQAQYGADIANYNAQQAGSPLGGLFSLGGAALGLPMAGGGSVGGNMLGGLFGL